MILLGNNAIKLSDPDVTFTKAELGPLSNILFLVGRIGRVGEYGQIDVDPSFKTLAIEAAKKTGVKARYARKILQSAGYDENPVELLQETARLFTTVEKYYSLVSRGKRIDAPVHTDSQLPQSECTLTIDPVLIKHQMIVSLFGNGSSLVIRLRLNESVINDVIIRPESMFRYALYNGALLNGEVIKPVQKGAKFSLDAIDMHETIIRNMNRAFQTNMPYSAVIALDSENAQQ